MTKRRLSIIVLLVATVILAMVMGRHWRRDLDLYTVTVLPSFRFVSALNDHGQVIGMEYFGQESHLLLWDRNSGVQDLGPVAGPGCMLVINNAGQICGTMIDPNGNWQAFLWEPGKGRTMLGTLTGGKSGALAMNNRGQIVGFSNNHAAQSGGTFLWDRATGMKELRIPGRHSCWPMCIDDNGRILVESYDSVERRRNLYLFDVNGPTLLGMLPEDISWFDMNNNGWLLGIREIVGKRVDLILWGKRGSLRHLRVRSEHPAVTRLNDRNQVAYTDFGDSSWEESHAFQTKRPLAPGWPTTSYLWDPQRGKIPLDRYVPDADRFRVKDLNNNGCIVGEVYTKSGQWQIVLLEPIPERWDK